MSKIRCKSCFTEFDEFCPIPNNELCDICHSATLNRDVCIWCGERAKEPASQCCAECAPVKAPLIGE